MDPRHFDAVVRALAAATSRRGFLGAAACGIAAIVGHGPGLLGGEAKRKKGKGKKRKKACGRSQKRCGSVCIPRSSCCTAADCAAGDACIGGRCGNCADASDCPAAPTCSTAVCRDGRCATEVLPAGSPCDDGQYCTVGTSCSTDGVCGGGAPRDCGDGLACTVDSCDEDADRCVHTPNHAACTTANPCRAGRCAPDDPGADTAGCVFDSIDLGTLTCGVGACQRTVTRCVGGELQTCVPGQPTPEVCNGIDDDCDGLVDEGNDLCPPRENSSASCVEGSCVYLCIAGYDDCDGDPLTPCDTLVFGNDVQNCGGCGAACTASGICQTPGCQSGSCFTSVTLDGPGPGCAGPGQRCCAGSCRSIDSDRSNCGRCGNVCGSGQGCCGGQCVTGCST